MKPFKLKRRACETYKSGARNRVLGFQQTGLLLLISAAMAVPEQQMQQSLRFGDVIFLHSREGRGYVFSETTRLVKRWNTLLLNSEL